MMDHDLPLPCEALILSYCPLMPCLLQWQSVCKLWRQMILQEEKLFRIEEFNYTSGRCQPVHFSKTLKVRLSLKVIGVVQLWTNLRHVDLRSTPEGVVTAKLLETMSHSLPMMETLILDKYVTTIPIVFIIIIIIIFLERRSKAWISFLNIVVCYNKSRSKMPKMSC